MPPRRLPVSLSHDDNELLKAIRHSEENRLGQQVSTAKIIRLALHCLAEKRKIKINDPNS